jgi:L-asparagine transporter-like permease
MKAFGWLSVVGVSIAIGGDLVVTQVRSSPPVFSFSSPETDLSRGHRQLLMGWWTDKLVWLPALFFMAFLAATNLYSVSSFGELEYFLSFVLFPVLLPVFRLTSPVASLLKVISIVIFFILGVVVNAGGNTTKTYSSSFLFFSS